MARSLRRDDDGVSTLWSFVGVVILVVAILGVYYGYVVPKLAAPPFATKYQATPASGTNVTDPFWGWTATVSVAGTIVTVTNSPIPGQLVRPYGAWDAQVVSIDDAANNGEGVILVHHLLTSAQVDRVGQKSAGGSVVFVVTGG